MEQMADLVLEMPRQIFRVGRDGIPETEKEHDEVERYTVQLGWILRDDDIDTVAWSADDGGLTITHEGTEEGVSTILVGNTGVAKVTITTATGRTLIRRVRFLAVDR